MQNLDQASGVSDASASRGMRISPLWFLLLLTGGIICIGITTGELHFNGDEMRHAFTGVFFRDLMADMPLHDPLRYTYEYYAKYPALGINHWPPFFYFVEGIFFLIFGVSVVTSRLAILFFSLLGVYFWYRIAERFGPRYRAVLAALIFPLVPYVLLYERVVMLEIPLIALCLGAIHFWLRFLESERAIHLWAVAAFVSAALLTSQKAAYVPFLLILHFVIERRFRLLLNWQVWLALSASLIAVLPWYMLTLRTSALSFERASGIGFGHASHWGHWWYYWRQLPGQVGPLLMVLGVAGAVWALLFAPRRYRFLLLWVSSTYVFFSLINEKDLRHTMIWIPALVYFALLAVEALFAHRRWALVAGAALAVYFVVGALQFDRPRMSGVGAAARYVTSQPDSDVIYYQGQFNGDFIFHVRMYDPEKRRVVARDKQVVATRIVSGYGKRAVLSTPEDVVEFFRLWGIRYAVIEDRDRIDELEMVRVALASTAFERVNEFTLWSNNAEMHNRKLYVYRYLGPTDRGREPIVIPMLTLREDIRADLNRLAGRPWPN